MMLIRENMGYKVALS